MPVNLTKLIDPLLLFGWIERLNGSTLVIDTFCNSVGRQALKDYGINTNLLCLHVGLASDYAGVIWNDSYCFLLPVNDAVRDYPLARNLVTLAVAVACEVIVIFVTTRQQ